MEDSPEGTTGRNRETQTRRRSGLKASRSKNCKRHSQILMDESNNMHVTAAFQQVVVCPNTYCLPPLHHSSLRDQSSSDQHNLHTAFTQYTQLDPRLKPIAAQERGAQENEFSTIIATAVPLENGTTDLSHDVPGRSAPQQGLPPADHEPLQILPVQAVR